MQKNLYANIPGVSQIESINITSGYGQSMDIATIVCGDTTLDINSDITIDMGYDDDHTTVFTGRIKVVTRNLENSNITLVAKDILVDAADFFMVSVNPDEPFSREDIKAEDLIRDLLLEASISSYIPLVPLSFTFGKHVPATFNLTSVMDAINQVASILAWEVHAELGIVYFTDIRPYWRSGADKDTDYGGSGHFSDGVDWAFCTDGSMTNADLANAGYPELTVNDQIKQMERVYSDENLRNRVVIYGRDNFFTEAKASSPYLPTDFYKTMVLASPLIDNGDMAASAANYDLSLLNRLTESITMDIMGTPHIKARQFCFVSDDFLGTHIAKKWFIREINHTWGTGGFTTKLTLSR